ncbi:uncharacterized protein LOC132296256 [Cornus florida]|uniref:uncharacterized protein LOC132296256 n=1 Tax=Cornus florida TaxID=4283 RepID=UPI0028A27118|nr:uncharacterized protein LOC132296256 [Cornus florida]
MPQPQYKNSPLHHTSSLPNLVPQHKNRRKYMPLSKKYSPSKNTDMAQSHATPPLHTLVAAMANNHLFNPPLLASSSLSDPWSYNKPLQKGTLTARSLKKAARMKEPNISGLMHEGSGSPGQAIHCSISVIGLNLSFFTSFIYASNCATERQVLWDDITHCSTIFAAGPWLLMGDFNVIPNIGEKHGGSMKWSTAMSDFKDCLQNAELEDLKFCGILYSWSDKSLGDACIAKKLDRALVNQKWTSSFPISECNFLTLGISDHSPILVTLDINKPQRRTPSGSLMLGHHTSFSYLQYKGFGAHTLKEQLCFKLFKLKTVLRTTCGKEFSELDSKIHAIQLELQSCQMDLDLSPIDSSLKELEGALTREFFRLGNIQEDILRQKSRMMIHDLEDIKIQVVNHFQSLLGQSPPPTHHISNLAPFISKVVPTSMHSFLEDPPSNLEIQSCMLKLNKDKAPGPDGYNASFFQKCWNIVGRTIIKAISEFFRNGKLLAEVNNTYIALVPKCQNPTSLHDYRPISYVNTIYKCISKLLATRLQSTLPLLIDQAQSAFVHGRKITDPILLAHELLRGYHKHGTPARCAIKVDFKKAFDSVKWDFIINCLSLHNFPPKFISLINACILSPSFTIALNGEFQGEQKITHLSYADDLLLFCHGDICSVSVLKSALDLFCSMSGLDINLSKSAVYFSRVHDHTQYEISSLLGIQAATLPVKYLGVPLISTNLKAQHYSLLVSRITHRVTNWTSRSLSYAGRLQLIKSVLVSTQNYWCNIFILPKGVIDELNKIFRRFLWSGPELKTSGSKVAWGKTTPTDYGLIGAIPTSSKLGTCGLLTSLSHAPGVGEKCWGPLSLRFPRSLMSEGGLHEDITVDNFIINNNWAFPIFLTNAIPELANLPAPDSSTRDTKRWIAFPTGQYSFSHTVSYLVGDLPNVPWHNLVWQSTTIPRMKFILWLAVQSKLPTLDNKSMSSHTNICPLCRLSTESHDHIFLNCPFTSPLWRFIKYMCSIHTAIRSWEPLV